MKAGPLQYALGSSYRENSFDYTPDNLSDTQNEIDPIAGLFPNEHSEGEFDVSEIYGELLVPIISDGPKGVEHFNVELGARISDWSMEQMPNLEHLQGVDRLGHLAALSDPRRLQPRIPRAELGRAVHQAHADLRRRRSDARLVLARPVGSRRASARRRARPRLRAQLAQTLAVLCRQLMGAAGLRLLLRPPIAVRRTRVGSAGVPNSFGNPNLREEQADTWTLGVAMDFLEDWSADGRLVADRASRT